VKRVILPLLLLFASLLVAAPAHAAAALTVWISATGSDANAGTQASPVLTLARVQNIVRTAAPDGDVEVRINQGTYLAAQTTWDYYIPGHTITFMPHDYEYGEGVSGIAGRPLFKSTNGVGWWLNVILPVGNPGMDTGLRFYYLAIEGYLKGGVIIQGGQHNVGGMRVPLGSGANGNTFFGMIFRWMGSAWVSGIGMGYGGIVLENSSRNSIRNNHFLNLENLDPDGPHIHGIYVEHGSSDNEVASNNFKSINGGPMRTRNLSNHNNVHHNRFELVLQAGYSEWYCNEGCVSRNPTASLECPSYGNDFHDNTLVSNYSGGLLDTWELYPDPGVWDAGPVACQHPLPEPRVVVSGNTGGS
jgi:hypothetical protein